MPPRISESPACLPVYPSHPLVRTSESPACLPVSESPACHARMSARNGKRSEQPETGPATRSRRVPPTRHDDARRVHASLEIMPQGASASPCLGRGAKLWPESLNAVGERQPLSCPYLFMVLYESSNAVGQRQCASQSPQCAAWVLSLNAVGERQPLPRASG